MGWCPGNTRSKGISNNDVDNVKPELFGPCMLRVKNYMIKMISDTLVFSDNTCIFAHIS